MNPFTAQAVDDLEAAADYIETHGWTQFTMRRQDGAVCAVGALLHVVGLYCQGEPSREATIETANRRRRAEALADMHVALVTNHCSSGLTGFNDDNGRTQYEVIDELRLTAKALRNGEMVVPWEMDRW